ncbi:hypothetical protein Tco_1386821 [Tanacetum coccineum]
MASVLLNGSPTSEFQFHCGLTQGDPLAPYLFILIMESLHLLLSRAIKAGIFKGIKTGLSLNADDAVFIGGMLKDRGVELLLTVIFVWVRGIRTQFWNGRKIPRTCSSVADWLRISSGSYAAGGIYHGTPFGSYAVVFMGSISSVKL